MKNQKLSLILILKYIHFKALSISINKGFRVNIDLKGKRVLVTGATGELGRVIVRTCALCGADVAIHFYKNREMAGKLVEEVRAKGGRAEAFQADVTDHDQIQAMKDHFCSTLGAPQIIVNNAVIQYQWRPLLEQDLSDYESQFRSCIMHNVSMVKAFVPEMIGDEFGRVISVNSECAMQMLPTQSAYVAGKRGMDGLLRVLAREVGEYGITVNQVAPGWTESEKIRACRPEGTDSYAGTVPLRRMGTDQEVANVIAFLASDLASFITGAYIPVCGGNVMPAI
ncbi:MAG: SDR family NAD(P)-dependent oxidoreductase [Chitinispirillaceae bacterium]